MIPRATGLQYVVLHHTGYSEPHFDLMLEVAPSHPLRTYRSPIWPIDREVQLTPLGEHRREYLSYEGPISGNRGQVQRITAGTYDLAGDGINIFVTFTSGTDHQPIIITDDARAMPQRLFRGNAGA